MINYEDFKSHERVIGKLPLIPLELSSAISQNVGEYIVYRGIKLRWTGFMSSPDSEKVSCRWQCYFRMATGDPNQAVGLFAMNTGLIAFYKQGETFDMRIREGFSEYCFLEDLLEWPKRIQEIKEKTLQMLKDAIDFNWNIIKPEASE